MRIDYVAFVFLGLRVWVTSLSIIFSSFIHLPAYFIILFCFTAEYYSIVYMHHIFIIHSSVKGYLNCFHCLTIVNRAPMNMSEQVSVE